MAIRKNSIRELNDNKSIRTRRISSHSLTNSNKTKRIQLHFRYVRKIKYLMSNYVFNHIEDFLFQENKDILGNQYKQFKNQEMSAWETQQTYQELFDKYHNSINTLKKQHKFKVQNKAITEIVLEDLNLQKTGFKTFNEEFGVSYNRLVKILRLNQVKHWFKNQANKRGIKVHFTSPCATSIECSVCHHIDKDNRRNQEEFKCVNCGHTTNADNQASHNISNRIKLDVLRDRLHNYDMYGQCTPKIMKRDNIKSTIENYYLKQSTLNVDPHNSRLLRETNSKSLI